MGAVIGLDTSCYTTSVALAESGEIAAQERKLLDVELGGRGLQQSQAVFQHVARLPHLIEKLMARSGGARIQAVCASARPRPVDGSYMPVFTVGEGFGRAMAAALGVPFFETSHQQGHLRAAMVGADLTDAPMLALHLSGGTTEILRAHGDSLDLMGGTGDLHAGQFVDRVGVALGLAFPAGSHLEKLAIQGQAESLLPASVNGLAVSFSGAETQVQRLIESGAHSPEQIAAEVFSCVARTIAKLIGNALASTGVRDVLLFGGVASSSLLKTILPDRLDRLHVRARLHWAEPELSGDNAAGVALIGENKLKKVQT
jgi:N6-L-threonylcarbamoyladenine synthase